MKKSPFHRTLVKQRAAHIGTFKVYFQHETTDRKFVIDFLSVVLDVIKIERIVQRGVVMEEFKQRCLNQPYGDVSHLMRPLAYKTHPYQWPTIGKDLSHIADATMDQVREFFYTHYAPNNAVLAVTGDIEFDEAVRLTQKWFGSIPSRELTERSYQQEAAQTEEQRLVVERNVPLDTLFMAFHMCDRSNPDYYAFDIIFYILSNCASSRLIQRLVRDKIGRAHV